MPVVGLREDRRQVRDRTVAGAVAFRRERFDFAAAGKQDRGNVLKQRNAQIFRLPPPAPHDSMRGVANQKECRAVRPPMPYGGAEPAAPSMNPAYLQHYEPTGEFRL
ncbi:hypothetical protein [Burkholderia metallica]|uniref:hypothetical protein n=1 Tax=Burkholderia metallica TaxID=488729 RepID=UPI001CF54D99|nr:hypothetical protein [Burkholderia metallica]MCA8017207.1 hypothetical protein [Burkholderia metallica]